MADGEVRAQDLTQETLSTLGGDEQFVMFDSVEGKRADLSVVADYIVQHGTINESTISALLTALDGKIGTLSNLNTTAKSNLVAAINEILANEGTLSSLTTDAKSTLVAAINEVKSETTALETEVAKKADADGNYENLTAGSAEQLIGDTYTEDKAPYLFRKSGGDLTVGTREYDTLVGSTVAWNQHERINRSSGATAGVNYTNNGDGSLTLSGTATANSFIPPSNTNTSDTAIVGHKYLGISNITNPSIGALSLGFYIDNTTKQIKGKASDIFVPSEEGKIQIGYRFASGTTFDNVKIYGGLFDLTQMLGSVIADYAYSLETATAGAGVAWLNRYGFIDGKYHPYDAGSLVSVHPSAHKMVGFNQWDEEWELGTYNTTTGAKTSDTTTIRCKNPVKVIPNTEYYMSPSNYAVRVLFYGADGGYLGNNILLNINRQFTTPSDAWYLCFHVSSLTTYSNDICINLNKTTGSPKNGDYVPYTANSYTLPDADLRGIFKLDSNNVPYCDGDTDDGSGTRTRKYELIDLGAQNWAYASDMNRFYTDIISNIKSAASSAIPNIVCPIYLTLSWSQFSDVSNNKTLGLSSDNRINIRDTAYTDAASFKTAMSGVYLVYEKSTPTTEASTAFTNPQVVDPDGTEEYIDEREVALTVGHDTKYLEDLVKKLESIPNPPSTNGTYKLTATVAGGVATLSWEA